MMVMITKTASGANMAAHGSVLSYYEYIHMYVCTFVYMYYNSKEPVCDKIGLKEEMTIDKFVTAPMPAEVHMQIENNRIKYVHTYVHIYVCAYKCIWTST